MKPACTLSVLAAMTLAACTRLPPARTDIQQFGLLEAPQDRPLVAEALKIAGEIEGPGAAPPLVPGWSPSANPQAVPVYAVDGAGLGGGELVSTFGACKCVLVNAAAFPKWLEAHTGEGAGRLDISLPDLLAYMLLHEAGHIADNDWGEGTELRSTSAAHAGAFNRDPTSQKDRETRADSFAANAIRNALQAGPSARSLAGAQVAMTIAKLSWNLEAHRLLDDFGGSSLRKSSLFGDAGLSHPNLEWRILAVNNMIAPTRASADNLAQFEAARSAGPLFAGGVISK